MKVRAPFTTLLLLLGCLLSAAPALGQSTAIVAAWNIGVFDPIPASRVRNIARAINVIKPDVIALTEVNPARSQDPTQTVLQQIVDRLDEEYWFIYFPENARQNIALLYRDGVEVTDNELIPGTDLGNPGLRKALAARVKVNNFDFIIVAVHPKAGRDAAARATRTEQARLVANYIRSHSRGGEGRSVGGRLQHDPGR